ncbi:MAG: F0F1 ATP synthase subunit delta [Opitutales bacterium]|nr:F0F1 ATP synthase subunit delta [Opitutales bacterium]
MTQDKQIKGFAKQLLKMSFENGELCVERVDGVLKTLEKNNQRHQIPVLKAYLKLVEREVAKSTAVSSYAGRLSPELATSISKKLSTKYGRNVRPVTREDRSLIGGLCVVVDCDVYDASIASSLASLESSLS